MIFPPGLSMGSGKFWKKAKLSAPTAASSGVSPAKPTSGATVDHAIVQ